MSASSNPPRNGEGDRRSRWRGRRVSGGRTAVPSTALRAVPLPVPGRNDEGFTLVELMVVIVILGLLATIVMINVMPALSRGKATAARADIADARKRDRHLSYQQSPLSDPRGGAAGARRQPHDQAAATHDPWGNAYVYSGAGPERPGL